MSLDVEDAVPEEEALLDHPPGFENAAVRRGLGFGGLCGAGCSNLGMDRGGDVPLYSAKMSNYGVSATADCSRDGNLGANCNQRNDIRITQGNTNASAASEYKMDILLNKLNFARRKPHAATTLVKSGYSASSLVWGKLRSHPWWPGQIFDPADSSKEALRHYKEGKLLVAYFGDKTFAWNQTTHLKPFQPYFSAMENQSDMETFHSAVDSALDEVSRRVEFGLSCTCLPQDVYVDIQSQIIENSGIYKKIRPRGFGDEECSSVESFIPSELVSYLKESAKSPQGFNDRLELVKYMAQLASFCRWKGYRKLPEFSLVGGWLDHDANLLSVDGREPNVQHHFLPSKSVIIKDQDEHPLKHESRPNCRMNERQKKKNISNLMCDNDSYLCHSRVEVQRKPKHKVRKEANSSENKVDETFCQSEMKDDTGMSARDAYISPTVRSVPDTLSPVGLFKQLSLTAVDPMKNHDRLVTLVEFFSQFRNLCCLNCPISTEATNFFVEESTEKIEKRTPKSDHRMPLSEHVEDSCWTAQIVEGSAANKSFMGSHKELGMVLDEHSARVGLPILRSEKDPQFHLSPNHKTQDPTSGNHELGDIHDTSGKQVLGKHKDGTMRTALLLKFSDLNAVPTLNDLNKIFGCYGPLHESETEIMKKSVAKVIFKRNCDAEAAFSSAGKYNTFGLSLVSYRLKYLTAKPRKVSSPAKKRQRKAALLKDGNPKKIKIST
uniref:PWWP domain-containing protein n=1 Tax=Kalanchoe fedtschenkoi TaxID=63787 RepID=A0A7N1A364_KALFE